ncbi:DoxX family protein [Paenibacillus residui]|uniref:DoxX family protein n=2 Tax=Paenibacillus TaxID=44249 RepID=A0ABW3DEM5_9BACL
MVIIIVQVILIVMFGISVTMKLLRTRSMVQHWKEYRYPMWFMNVVALLELAGVIGLLAAFWVPVLLKAPAALLIILMLGAIHAHLVRAKHKPIMALNACAMLILSIVIIVLEGSAGM